MVGERFEVQGTLTSGAHQAQGTRFIVNGKLMP